MSRECYPNPVYPDWAITSNAWVAGTGKGDTPRQRAFGDRVKTRRDALGLTQEGLAHNGKINRTYIATLENGDRNPSLDLMARLALALQWDLADLVQGLQDLPGRKELDAEQRRRRNQKLSDRAAQRAQARYQHQEHRRER